MKIIVTGVKGQLGFDCVRELKKRGYFDIIAIDKSELDITNEEDVSSFVNESKPNVIMHNAAYTSVDKAEEEPDIAYSVNALGTKYLAESAERVGAKFLYISTDYVFSDSNNNFHKVDDETKPLTVYGKTKLEGEAFAKLCSKHFIVRISWVFGKNGNNFVRTMLNLSKTNKQLSIVDDQIGSPTYTLDLSRLLVDMIETDKYGVYHATNEGVCSWADFAEEIFRLTNKNTKLKRIKTSEYVRIKPNQAPRPLNSKMDKSSLDDAGFDRLPSWQDALKRYLEEIGEI